MEFAYLTPRCVQDLYDDVLIDSAAEFRFALHILSGAPVHEGDDLRMALLRLVETFEQEIERRGHA